MKRVLFFVLYLFMVPDSFSQNLVINPAFDVWGRVDKPTGWTNTQGCLKDSVYVQSDDYSCRQEATTESRDLGQKFSVTPDRKYRFSFFYKTAAASPGNGCRVWCTWLDDNKIAIDDPSGELLLHSGFLKNESWQQYEAALTAPSNAGYFYLLVRSLPNSITYWDDFIFEEDILSSSTENMMPDLILYPNPVRDYLIISNMQDAYFIDIQSLTGITVWSSAISDENTIKVSVVQLADGMYIVRIRCKEKVLVRKFLKYSK